MKKIGGSFLIGGLSLVIASCASSNKVADQLSVVGEAGNVTVIDLTKTNDLATGNTLVRFKFAATGKKVEQVMWRCEFYDANGNSVGETARMVEATIYPNDPVAETCTFPSKVAVDFKIKIQNIATNMINYN